MWRQSPLLGPLFSHPQTQIPLLLKEPGGQALCEHFTIQPFQVNLGFTDSA